MIDGRVVPKRRLRRRTAGAAARRRCVAVCVYVYTLWSCVHGCVCRYVGVINVMGEINGCVSRLAARLGLHSVCMVPFRKEQSDKTFLSKIQREPRHGRKYSKMLDFLRV